MVTGRRSQTMLEQIGRLKDLANDDSRPDHIRAQATEELARIEAGGKVHGAHLRMNAALSLDELDRIAADPTQTELVRAQAAASAAQVRDAGAADTRAAELAALAADAIARVTAENRAKTKRSAPKQPVRPALALVVLPPRAFVALWTDMQGWATRYDSDNLAASLTVAEWEQAETVLAETIAFFTLIRDARNQADASPKPAADVRTA